MDSEDSVCEDCEAEDAEVAEDTVLTEAEDAVEAELWVAVADDTEDAVEAEDSVCEL